MKWSVSKATWKVNPLNPGRMIPDVVELKRETNPIEIFELHKQESETLRFSFYYCDWGFVFDPHNQPRLSEFLRNGPVKQHLQERLISEWEKDLKGEKQ
jgi:hypothetical protein